MQEKNHQNSTVVILCGDSARATTCTVARKPKQPTSALGLRVRNARLAKGLSQPALEKLARVPQAAISQIETGARTANFESGTLLALERALDLWPGELMALMGDRVVADSRERFIKKHRGLLGEDDIADLRRVSWFGGNEDPPDEAWLGVVHARRMVRQRKESASDKGTPTNKEQ